VSADIDAAEEDNECHVRIMKKKAESRYRKFPRRPKPGFSPANVDESHASRTHQLTMVNLAAYLERIGYSGPVSPDEETLRQIHRAHLLAVPFENLDIAWGKTIEVNQEAFVRKVVERRRGGFCYELNGAFAALLQALGFRVTLLSARVAREDGSYGREFDHLALRVDLEQPWLADVGFGDSFVDPLRLEAGLEQDQTVGRFRIEQAGNALRLERRRVDGEWTPEYRFSLEPRRLEEFEGMCHYHQTSPQSSFTQKRVCSLATPKGRVTLSDMKLITTSEGGRAERLLESDADWRAILADHFGIVAP
jgi:N-hydroxyarylamine O-acetyltransferase